MSRRTDKPINDVVLPSHSVEPLVHNHTFPMRTAFKDCICGLHLRNDLRIEKPFSMPYTILNIQHILSTITQSISVPTEVRVDRSHPGEEGVDLSVLGNHQLVAAHGEDWGVVVDVTQCDVDATGTAATSPIRGPHSQCVLVY